MWLQGNVKESKFDKDFFKKFSLVLNGLDNVEARRHVNRLCLSAGVPLIESGTEGYLGQVCRTLHLDASYFSQIMKLCRGEVCPSGDSSLQAQECSRRGDACDRVL